MATIDKVRALLAEQLGKPIEKITEDAEIVKDLEADSLDVVEMLMKLEEELGITIPDEQMQDVKTVGDIARVIDKNL